MRPPGMVGFGLCDLEPYRRHPERSRFSGGASELACIATAFRLKAHSLDVHLSLFAAS